MRERGEAWLVGGAAAVAAGAMAAALLGADPPLLHHDARAHLVVARRLTDGLRPGLHQLGAGWLPGYTLLMAPVVAAWSAYATGWVGAALSVACHGLGAVALLRLLRTAGIDRRPAAWVASVWALAPGPLALAGMPMTETPTLALVLWGFALPDGVRSGLLLGLAATLRYEGVAALAAGLATSDRRGRTAAGAGAIAGPIYGIQLASRPDLGGALADRLVGGPGAAWLIAAWLVAAVAVWGLPLLACLAGARPRARLDQRLVSLALAFPASLAMGMPPRPRYAVFLGPLLALGLARLGRGRPWLLALALLGAGLPTLGVPPASLAPAIIAAWADAPPGLDRALGDGPAWARHNAVVLEARVSDLRSAGRTALIERIHRDALPGDRVVAGMADHAGFIHRLGWSLSRVIWEGDGRCWTDPRPCGGRWFADGTRLEPSGEHTRLRSSPWTASSSPPPSPIPATPPPSSP